MTSRRTTRASSRAVSSREESPAISVIDNSKASVKGRLIRPSNPTLPAVGLKSSTAYGTNNNAQPTRVSAPKVANDVRDFLYEILKPETKTVNSTRPSLSPSVSTPSRDREFYKDTPERSFGTESSIFRGATLESSVIDPEEFYAIPQNHRSHSNETSVNDSSDKDDEVKNVNHTLQSNISNHDDAGPDSNLDSFGLIKFLDKLIGSTSVWKLTSILVGVVLLLFTSIFKNLPTTVSSVENFFPEFTLRGSSFNEDTSIRQRLSKLEFEVSRIQKQTSSFDPSAAMKLAEILPSALVVDKKNGKLQLSQDFWQALRDKICSEYDSIGLQQSRISQSKEKDQNFSHVKLDKNWNRFLQENERKIEQRWDENLTNRFPQLLRENEIVSRAEIVNIVRENWEQNNAQINLDLKNVISELRHSLQDKKIQVSNLSREEKMKLAAELTKYLPSAQLLAAAQVNIQNSINLSNIRINHFCPSTGALIDAYNTSPNYVFPSQAKIWWYERWIRSFMTNPVPIPKPPKEALMKWYEHGDCWCSSALGGHGFGPSLGIILGNMVYPEEVVVEHIPSSLALEPGSAPRMLELFAAIENSEIEPIIRQQSQKIFSDLKPDPISGLKGYVRIAAWDYEIDASSNIQTHKIPLDLKAFGVGTSKFVVRSISNWGEGNVDYTCIYRIRLHGPIYKPALK